MLYLPRRGEAEACAKLHATEVGPVKVESIFARRYRLAAGEGRIVRWECDPEATNVTLSEGWRDLVGADGLRHLSSEWTAVVHPDDRFEAALRWLRGRMTGVAYRGVSRCWAYGSYRPVLLSAFPLIYERGEVVRWEGYWELLGARKAVNF